MHISVNKNIGMFMILGNWDTQKAILLQQLSQLKNDILKIETVKEHNFIKRMGIEFNKNENIISNIKTSYNGTGKGK